MKHFLSRCKDGWNRFVEKLSEIEFFRKIGITYQVLWNLLLITLIIGLLSAMFAGGAAAGYFASLVADEPSYSEEDMRMQVSSLTETSEIYMANDVFLGKIRSDVEREIVRLDEIADNVKWAIIATEDEHFYEHEGIVPKALLRATMQELSNASMQTGGSTLTQQLIKQQILSNEVSFDRKATEIMLALRLEQFMSKDEILEAYLNVVPFGRNASGRNVEGIEAAANGIFGVTAEELNLPQSAYLAGMPQSPYGYTPFTSEAQVKDEDGLRPGLNRYRTVLNRMLEKGYITKEEHEEALSYDLTADFAENAPDPMSENPMLTSEINRRATAVLVQQKIDAHEGWDQLSTTAQEIERTEFLEQVENAIINGGYKITTTIDKELYDAMNAAAQNSDAFFGAEKQGQREQVGSVLIDNNTGAILSFVGGREEDLDHQYNHATQAYRQAGSTMKPVLAYGGAIEAGVTQPGLVIPDTEERYKVNNKPINNFDRSHKGNLTVRESVIQSRNVPAVRAWWHVPDSLKEQIRDAAGFGAGSNRVPLYESAAIGGGHVTVEQMVSAFSAFGHDGVRNEPYMIEKIETYSGEVIYERQQKEHTLFSPQTNYLVTDMMRDVLYASNGTASGVPRKLNFSADWAGKTGTTNESFDSWFIATNPDVTLGVWNGYSGDKQISLDDRISGMSTGARTQSIWANIANAAYSVNPDLMTANGKRFERPSGITEKRVCGLTGGSSNKVCDDEGLVTTDLYASDMLSRIDGLSPFQSELKRDMQRLINEQREKEREERRQQEDDDEEESADDEEQTNEEVNSNSEEEETEEEQEPDDEDEELEDEEDAEVDENEEEENEEN